MLLWIVQILRLSSGQRLMAVCGGLSWTCRHENIAHCCVLTNTAPGETAYMPFLLLPAWVFCKGVHHGFFRFSVFRFRHQLFQSTLQAKMTIAPGFSRGAFSAHLRPPTVAGFFIPFPCGGSSGVLSSLFYTGILFHPGILSACVGFLVPPRHRRRIIPLLQGRYKPCIGRFPGVASCTLSRFLCRPGQRGGPVSVA